MLIKMRAAFTILLILLIAVGTTQANEYSIGRSTNLNLSNTRYVLTGNILSGSPFVFADGTQNSTLACGSHAISLATSIVFGNETYNNTITNCTISGNVFSLHDAQNNLVNVTGNYTLGFSDNSSNVGVGNYFHLLVYANDHNYSIARFVQIVPKALVDANPGVINEGETPTQLSDAAAQANYSLPRFGVYYPTIYPENSSNGSSYYPVEGEEVSKAGTRSFNPYTFYTPYIGDDMIASTSFNATSGTTFRPTYIRPRLAPYTFFPAGTNITYNFSIIFHNETPYSKFRLLNGWQNDPNASVIATFFNLTNGTLSYKATSMLPGIHAFILLLDTPYEHENSTSIAYGVGIPYCADGTQAVYMPGYYPFAFNTLNEVNVFWHTNQTCAVGVKVRGSDITVDCKGGSVNTSDVGFSVKSSANVLLQNCRVRGNGLFSNNSNVSVYNSTFMADNASNYAIDAFNSTITLDNVSFVNFARPIESSLSSITNRSNVNSVHVTSTVATSTATTSAPPPTAQTARTGGEVEGPKKGTAYSTQFGAAALIIGMLLLYVAMREIKNGH